MRHRDGHHTISLICHSNPHTTYYKFICERLRYVPHFIPRVPLSVLRVVIYSHLERFDGGDEAGAPLRSCIAPLNMYRIRLMSLMLLYECGTRGLEDSALPIRNSRLGNYISRVFENGNTTCALETHKLMKTLQKRKSLFLGCNIQQRHKHTKCPCHSACVEAYIS